MIKMTEEKDLNFIPEIQEMMFGLGDCPNPLESTAKVIEEIVLDQMHSILCQAEEISARRNAKIISPQDLLFLMRNDAVKLQRLINYLALKDQKSVFQNGLAFSSNGDVSVDGTTYMVSMQSNRSQICIAYLKELGIDISTDPSKQIFDPVKIKRQMRADWMSKTLPPKLYAEYAKSRQLSFHGRFRKIQKFLDWISARHGENIVPKLKTSTHDILVYLAKETIAQLLDLVFLLRQDKMAAPGNPYSKAVIMNAHSNLRKEVYGSNSRVESTSPVTPEEIREVVRRYWSNQLCPFGLFSRTFSRNIRNRVMACY
ncbi:transcription initiation protein SPT3 homolog [Planococcus citri]|uniref:transcription initiation protein SPT3 homolog n=1 Tax=Planococcus citri TaxID=170843 RepID=UPI0031F7815D